MDSELPSKSAGPLISEVLMGGGEAGMLGVCLAELAEDREWHSLLGRPHRQQPPCLPALGCRAECFHLNPTSPIQRGGGTEAWEGDSSGPSALGALPPGTDERAPEGKG